MYKYQFDFFTELFFSNLCTQRIKLQTVQIPWLHPSEADNMFHALHCLKALVTYLLGKYPIMLERFNLRGLSTPEPATK